MTKRLKILITCGIVLVSGLAVIAYLLKSVPPTSQERGIVEPEAWEGTREDPHARVRYKRLLLQDPATGEILKDIGRRELEFVKNLAATTTEQSVALDTQWAARGPCNIGGRTKALAIDVTDENIIHAGCVSSGMWKSTDAGVSWRKTTAPDQLHSVSCIAQNTYPDSGNIWYYGTGEWSGGMGGSASGEESSGY